MARSITSLSTCAPSPWPRRLGKPSLKDSSLRGRRQIHHVVIDVRPNQHASGTPGAGRTHLAHAAVFSRDAVVPGTRSQGTGYVGRHTAGPALLPHHVQ